MFGKKKPQVNPKQTRRLTRAERRQIEEAIEKAKRGSKKGISAQETIPYKRMFQTGLCQLSEKTWAKTIRFQDITYQLATDKDKEIIFGKWCKFLNYFDPSIRFQFVFVDLTTSEARVAATLDLPAVGDGFDESRADFSKILRTQSSKGNNGITRAKYLSFSIEEPDAEEAASRLNSIEIDLINNFKQMGVIAESLDGKECLALLHDILHMDQEPFRFAWDWLPMSGLNTKDFIVPSSFEFKSGRLFRMGKKFCQVSFLQILAPELEDRILKDFLDMQNNLVLTMHIQSLDQVKAIKQVKRKITDLDKSKIDEQKKAIRAGYDMDIIPSDLATYSEEAKNLLKDLQKHNERMFMVTILLLNVADSKRKLKEAVLQASSVAQRYNCALTPLDFQQEQGLVSCLPLAQNQVPITRGLTTASTAIFVPFTTQELFQTGREALYYGVNAMSYNLIMADRKTLNNPNGLVLGTPGSGKSFAGKREIVSVILCCPDDDVIICDPEGEYGLLVNNFRGQEIKVSTVSEQHINPLDINLDYSEDDNPLAFKTDFILGLCELIIGRKDGLAPAEKSVIDRCVREIYKPYLGNPIPENMPILEDLYDKLLDQEEKEASFIATALEIYVHGSLNVFNHRTNVDVDNRIVSYNIKELGKQLKKIGMLIVQDQVWNRLTRNREAKRYTRYYIDEFHLLLKEEQTAAYSVEIYKRFRKWGGIPTGLTQNVKDFLRSKEIENIFDNCDFILMLNQADGDQEILAPRLHISEQQLSYVTQAPAGSGLLFFGNTIIPFKDRFPKDSSLYRLMTTKPQEVAAAEDKPA